MNKWMFVIFLYLKIQFNRYLWVHQDKWQFSTDFTAKSAQEELHLNSVRDNDAKCVTIFWVGKPKSNKQIHEMMVFAKRKQLRAPKVVLTKWSKPSCCLHVSLGHPKRFLGDWHCCWAKEQGTWSSLDLSLVELGSLRLFPSKRPCCDIVRFGIEQHPHLVEPLLWSSWPLCSNCSEPQCWCQCVRHGSRVACPVSLRAPIRQG